MVSPTNLTYIDFQSPAGPWRLHIHQPTPPIPGIQSLWAVEAHTAEFREKVLPRATVEWMINLATGPHHILHRDGHHKSTHSNAWLSGLQRECLCIESPLPPCFIAVSLHPAYAAAITGIDPARFTETVIELAPLPLYSDLRQANSWPDRFQILEKHLRTITPQPNQTIIQAVNTITASNGTIPIQQISQSVQISHKHFIALFTKTTGLSPKRFARLIRLARAVAQSQSETVNWTAVAHDCGFHDQAHFNREFKRFTGATPTEFLATREASGQAMLAG